MKFRMGYILGQMMSLNFKGLKEKVCCLTILELN